MRVEIELQRLTRSVFVFREAGSVVAKMNVLFDKDSHEKAFEEMMQRQEKSNEVTDKLSEGDMAEGTIVKRAIFDSVATGKVGALNVDPYYLDFNALEGT